MADMALLTQSIAVAANAGFHGNMKAMDRWVNKLVGKRKANPTGQTGNRELGEFIRALQSEGKVTVRGSNSRRTSSPTRSANR